MKNCKTSEKQTCVWIPQPGFVFPVEEDLYGKRLVLIFGNENGKCPFYGSECNFCQIGAGEYNGHKFFFTENCQRLEWFVSHYGKNLLKSIDHLLIYNSGSVLDKKEMSLKTLGSILDLTATTISPSVVSLDTREIYITDEALLFLKESVSSGIRIHFSIGLETIDKKTRENVLNKHISLDAKQYEQISAQGYKDLFGFDVNFIFGIPGISIQQSIKSITQGIEHYNRLSIQYGIKTDFNIHPYYPNKKTELHFPGSHTPEDKDYYLLLDSLTLLKRKIGDRHNIYIGLNDEGLSVGSTTLNKIAKQIYNFNITREK